MCDLYAFVDEFGTPALNTNKDNVTNIFVLAAVLVRREDIGVVLEATEKIGLIHFQGSEIKSSKIGGNDGRRRRILADLIEVPFSYYALAINKNRISDKAGLSHKRSFYKYFHKMLDNKLARPDSKISIVADRIGSQEFMEGFKKYLSDSVDLPLFPNFPISFSDWKDAPLLQIADLVAGTLGKIYDADHMTEASVEFQNLLQPKEIGILPWPLYWKSLKDVKHLMELTGTEWDEAIAKKCLGEISRVMDDNAKSSSEISRMQNVVLERLLQKRLFSSNNFITKDKLLSVLNKNGYEIEMSRFSSEIIGDLRDRGIIFAGTNSGMRLAMTLADIQDYIAHVYDVISPMLSRLDAARESVKMATLNRVDGAGGFDVLSISSYDVLKKIADCYKDYVLKQTMCCDGKGHPE